MPKHPSISTRRRPSGITPLRFRFVGLGLLAALLVSADIGYSVWARTALEQSVREGTRFAITGRSFDHMDHNESIRQVVRKNSSGLLNDAEDSQIEVSYSNTESDIAFLHLKVKAFRRTPLAVVLGSSYPIELAADCSDVVESLGTPSDRVRLQHLAEMRGGNSRLVENLR